MRAPLAQLDYWVRTVTSKKDLTYDLNKALPAKYLLYSGHDQQIANMIEYLLPKFGYDYVPYSSIITLELRLDNECIRTVMFNSEDCLNIRMKYNGDFVDLASKTVVVGSAIQDNPSNTMDSYEIAAIQDKYDMPYGKVKSILNELLYQGDIKEACAEEYVPNPDPDTLQYYVENE